MQNLILAKVHGLIAPDRLSYIQEAVLLRSCEGKRYQEIAALVIYSMKAQGNGTSQNLR